MSDVVEDILGKSEDLALTCRKIYWRSMRSAQVCRGRPACQFRLLMV